MLAVTALELAAYWGVSRGLDTLLDRELVDRRQVVEEYVADHVARRAWPELAQAIEQHRGFQPEWLGIQDESGRTLYMGAKLEQALTNPAGLNARIRREIRPVGGQRYVFLAGTDATIAVGLLERLRWLMLLSAPVLLMVASAAGHWMAGRALRPIADLAAAAQGIDASRLATRLAVPATRDEIQTLAETINRMLARIESAFEQMKQFTADASHELRTPLAVIRSTAEVALMRAGRPPEREALERILRQAERNSQLLDDMLRMARLEAGAEPVRREPVDIERSLLEAAAPFAAVAERRDVAIETDFAEGEWLVAGDEAHLRRLWTILLDNALKFTPDGGEIHVRLAAQLPETVVCSIRDTGPGIAAADLPHVFERFYRADKSRTAGGFGLGLALARQIAESHRASISVQSQYGHGTCVTVLFPRASVTHFSGNSQVVQTALK